MADADRPQASQPPEAQTTIIDIAPLSVAPKSIPPREQQLPNESLTLWDGVTQAILSKHFSKATAIKVELEEAQREKARQRERTGEVWKPAFFVQPTELTGKPELNAKGKELLNRAQRGEWSLEKMMP